MMTLRARILAALIGLAVLFVVSFLIRRRRLDNIYAITWFVVSVLFLGMACFPALVEHLSGLLGIYSTTTAILVVAIGGLMAIVMHLSIIVTDQNRQIRRYEKEIALLNTKNGS